MNEVLDKAEDLADTIKEYINIRIEAGKLSIAEKSSEVISNLTARIAIAIVVLLFLVFSGIAFSLILGAWFENTWAGFLAVSLLYLLLGFMIWGLKGRIIRLQIMNSMIHEIFKNDKQN